MVAKCKKRIGVDLSYIHHNHIRGQAMCGLNLLKGIAKVYDAQYDLVVFCEEALSKQILDIVPFAEIVYTKHSNLYGSTNRFKIVAWYIERALYSEFELTKIIKNANLDSLIILHEFVSFRNPYKDIFTILNTQDFGPLCSEKGSLLHNLYNRIATMCYKIDLEHCNIIIALSETDSVPLIEKWPQYIKKLQVIYVPIEMGSLIVNDGMQAVNNCIVVLNYAYAHKNGIVVVKAFEKVMNRITQNLVLIGYEDENISNYVREHNLSDRVIITGRVDDETRDKYLSGCDLYVSASSYEGFGMPTVEAILAGHKVLLADIPVNHEVSKELAHFYSPADSVNALADAIEQELLMNYVIPQDERIKLQQRFAVDTITKQYINLALRGADGEIDKHI